MPLSAWAGKPRLIQSRKRIGLNFNPSATGGIVTQGLGFDKKEVEEGKSEVRNQEPEVAGGK